jgi:hypothetical protein
MTLSVQFFMGERHGTFNGNYSSGVTGSVCFDSTPDSVAGGDRVGSRRIHQGRICRGCWNGRGALTFRGRNYPFKVSGDSLGATIGASITKFIGRAPNMRGAGDIAGTYAAMGAGGSLGGGVGGVQLENGSGVILQLHGVKVGMELSLNLAGITITMDRRSAS